MTFRKRILLSAVVGLLIASAVTGVSTYRDHQRLRNLRRGYEACARTGAHCGMYVFALGPLSYPVHPAIGAVSWLFWTGISYVVIGLANRRK
jgi:hypothetical protein